MSGNSSDEKRTSIIPDCLFWGAVKATDFSLKKTCSHLSFEEMKEGVLVFEMKNGRDICTAEGQSMPY